MKALYYNETNEKFLWPPPFGLSLRHHPFMGTKRKAKPAVDFKKTKPKLGKGKQPASNATDTSFKAKAIAMPQQSIMLDRSQTATTRRRQTLNDLIQQTHHPSSGARKDAVMGMLELVTTYQGFLEQNTTSLINTALPLIGDDDVHVRAAIARYFTNLLASIPDDTFAPYASSMLLMTSSAMSHISMFVRIDALQILSLLLDKVPSIATQDWESALDAKHSSDSHGQRILQAFFAMLGVAAGAQRARSGLVATSLSTTSVNLSASQRLTVLRSLYKFLCQAMRDSQSHGMPLWCFQSAFASPSDLEQFEQLFHHSSLEAHPWTIAHVPGASTHVVFENLMSAARVDQSVDAAPESIHERLAHVLHASLLSTLLDSLPAALAPDGSSSEVHADLVMHLLRIYLLLWRRIITLHIKTRATQGTNDVPIKSITQLEQLLAHLGPYFTGSIDGPHVRLELHVIYCELVSLCTMAAHERAPSKHLPSVLAFLQTLLTQNHAALTHNLYQALLPTFWLVLSTPIDGNVDILSALLAHFDTVQNRALHMVAFHFLARIAMLPTFRSLQVQVLPLYTPSLRAAWHTWILSLPRLLWQSATYAVSSRTSSSSEEEARAALTLAQHILEFLHCTLLPARHPLFEHEALVTELAPRVAPLFHVHHPKRGIVPGPYRKLPVPTQRMAEAVVQLIPISPLR